nr:MAG TPA: hypothetical protein [Caudoviricetes sp.]
MKRQAFGAAAFLFLRFAGGFCFIRTSFVESIAIYWMM